MSGEVQTFIASATFVYFYRCCVVVNSCYGIHSQEIVPDWWRRMARISLDCPNSFPGIPLSVLTVPMENKYKCQQCHLVLRKPVQAQCGHRFCVHCFKQLTRYTGGPETTYKRVKCKPTPPTMLYPLTGHASTHPVFLSLLASGVLCTQDQLLYADSSLTWLKSMTHKDLTMLTHSKGVLVFFSTSCPLMHCECIRNTLVYDLMFNHTLMVSLNMMWHYRGLNHFNSYS